MLLLLCLCLAAVLATACSEETVTPQDDDGDASGGKMSGGASSVDGGSGGEESGGAPRMGDDCEGLSEADCLTAEEDCLLVTARQLGRDDSGEICVTDESLVQCRTVGKGCSDGDAESYWCGPDEKMWVTPQSCGPADAQACDSPEVVPDPCPK